MATTRPVKLLYGTYNPHGWRGERVKLGPAYLETVAVADHEAHVVAIRKSANNEPECPYRLWDGALWEPWSAKALKPGNEFGVAMSLSQRLCWWQKGLKEVEEISAAYGTARDADRAFRRKADYSAEPGIQRIAWKARNLLLVDDVVYVRSLGPHFSVQPNRDHSTEDLSGIEPRFPSITTCGPFEYGEKGGFTLRIDAGPELMETLYDLDISPPEGFDIDMMARDFLVLDRDALDAIDHAPHSLVNFAETAAWGIGVAKLDDAPHVAIAAHAGLRREVMSIHGAIEVLGRAGAHRSDRIWDYPTMPLDGIRNAIAALDDPLIVETASARVASYLRLGLRTFGMDETLRADARELAGIGL